MIMTVEPPVVHPSLGEMALIQGTADVGYKPNKKYYCVHILEWREDLLSSPSWSLVLPGDQINIGEASKYDENLHLTANIDMTFASGGSVK